MKIPKAVSHSGWYIRYFGQKRSGGGDGVFDFRREDGRFAGS